MSHFALLLGVALFESTLAKHVGQQRIVVDANGADADTGSSLLRREAELMRLDEGADQRQAVRADCTGLLMAFSCDEHKTAAVCESHKVNSGSDAIQMQLEAVSTCRGQPSSAGELLRRSCSGLLRNHQLYRA
eukprot:CAMPEP_0181486592 /NCGR_PEP_ID=MMETSP1110-20121109/47274_1 /TAXON_ID=174948 /ORGANISM="Symbiodinium sp., Strain CCMP421" /LENGTH=132 /DNA_ID=CAMNT_0023612855 /DNA_START=112 /DNA_END=506 /DNA_ORIENTATION=+